jgi:Ca2+-binding EF-hand superfamily protein
MKIRPVGAELFQADGRTDKTKLRVAFRNFANEPKKDFFNRLKNTYTTPEKESSSLRSVVCVCSVV